MKQGSLSALETREIHHLVMGLGRLTPIEIVRIFQDTDVPVKNIS